MNFKKKILPLAITIILGIGTLGIANAAVPVQQKIAGLLPNGLTNESTNLIDISKYNISQEDFVLLVKIISAEAQGESYSTQVAVGAVVLNRVASSQFPNTIKGVIYDKSNGIYQFTPVENGYIYNAPTVSAIKAAQDALKGADPTNGALYFFETAVTTNKFLKALPVAGQMGAFTFSYENSTKGTIGSKALVAKPSNINTAASTSAVSNKSVKLNNNYKAQVKQAPSYSGKKIQNVAQKQSAGYNSAGHNNGYRMKSAQGTHVANKGNVSNGSWGNNNWNNKNCYR